MISIVFFSFMCAVIGEVYCNVLTEPSQILSGWYSFLERKIGNSVFFKPLIACEKCFTGQFAFWVYLFRNWKSYRQSYVDHMIEHMFVICFSIYLVIILHYIYKWIKQR